MEKPKQETFEEEKLKKLVSEEVKKTLNELRSNNKLDLRVGYTYLLKYPRIISNVFKAGFYRWDNDKYGDITCNIDELEEKKNKAIKVKLNNIASENYDRLSRDFWHQSIQEALYSVIMRYIEWKRKSFI